MVGISWRMNASRVMAMYMKSEKREGLDTKYMCLLETKKYCNCSR